MPEMPEVETIRRYLNKKLIGKTIANVDILLTRQIQNVSKEKFVAKIVGSEIINIDRIGKYLIVRLNNKLNIIFHLRMTGRLVYSANGENTDKYARIIFDLTGGEKLIYGDTRTLGVIYLLEDEKDLKAIANMGAEPLSAEFTLQYLKNVLKNRKSRIKTILLNQNYISGIGNIYADEALFLARINPFAVANEIDENGVHRLFDAINKVIGDGIADGGTTFRDYQNGEGKTGHHQDNLFVYGREGKPCKICQEKIEKTFLGGRGTHFCPKCQPMKEKKLT